MLNRPCRLYWETVLTIGNEQSQMFSMAAKVVTNFKAQTESSTSTSSIANLQQATSLNEVLRTKALVTPPTAKSRTRSRAYACSARGSERAQFFWQSILTDLQCTLQSGATTPTTKPTTISHSATVAVIAGLSWQHHRCNDR